MKVLIIEDEIPARQKLKSMLGHLDGSISVVGEVGRVSDALHWLATNPAPDFAFVDIQLSDDHSFEIFKRQPIHFPVIFTTAFDKYILESFEYNSIDYLLKPITQDKLRKAIEKINTLRKHFLQGAITSLVNKPNGPNPKFVARKGSEFVVLESGEIAYFFTEHKIVFVRDFSGRQFMLDKNLSEVEADLKPMAFFRLNRKFLASQKAIEKFKPVSGKIQVYLKPELKEEVFVSKESAPDFRNWVAS